MFFRLFGNYLKEKNLLDAAQLEELINYRKMNRVKLGMLAVEQGLMTVEQAEAVNRLQAVQDKRFGEIAIENGYLTSADMGMLISKQGNPYFLFLQAVQEKNYITKEKLYDMLQSYREEKNFTDAELEVIKGGVVDDVANLLLHADDKYAEGLLRLAVRNLVRFISSDVYFTAIERADKFEAAQLASQKIIGTVPMLLGISSENAEMLELACIFGKEEFDALDADAYDAICEFINCNNGLYARTNSTLNCEMELLPPTFEENAELAGDMYLLTVYVNNKKLTVFVKRD